MLKKAVPQGLFNSLYFFLGEWSRLPFTSRIDRAHSYRARSASKKGTWPPPLLLAGFFSILLGAFLPGPHPPCRNYPLHTFNSFEHLIEMAGI